MLKVVFIRRNSPGFRLSYEQGKAQLAYICMFVSWSRNILNSVAQSFRKLKVLILLVFP